MNAKFNFLSVVLVVLIISICNLFEFKLFSHNLNLIQDLNSLREAEISSIKFSGNDGGRKFSKNLNDLEFKKIASNLYSFAAYLPSHPVVLKRSRTIEVKYSKETFRIECIFLDEKAYDQPSSYFKITNKNGDSTTATNHDLFLILRDIQASP